jgi:hypothetical protein
MNDMPMSMASQPMFAAHVVNMVHIVYIIGMETLFPVRKALQFTTEQWEQVRAFRFEQKISTEADAVRRLIQIGLEATAKPQPAKQPNKRPKPAKRPGKQPSS